MLSWEELNHQCGHCQGCSLSQKSTQVTVGEGDQTAQVMCVVHTPGAQGKVLSQGEWAMLKDLLSLAEVSSVYVTSVVKCRPPQGRGALHLEQHTCLPWLRTQTALLRPKLIVCLGQEAAWAIMGQEITLEEHHGQWFRRGGMDMMAMEHPRVLLRDGQKRPQGFLDAKSLGKKARQMWIS